MRNAARSTQTQTQTQALMQTQTQTHANGMLVYYIALAGVKSILIFTNTGAFECVHASVEATLEHAQT